MTTPCVPRDQVAYEAGLQQARLLVQRRLASLLDTACDSEALGIAIHALTDVSDDIWTEVERSEAWRLSTQGLTS